MGRLQGKVALVTGSSRGIGRAIAESFGREGASVIVNYQTDRVAADDAVRAIEAAGSKAVAVQANMANAESIRALYRQALGAFGQLDIVVNNAHPNSSIGEIGSLSEALIDEQLLTLKGYIISMQEAARTVRDGGAIINFSSGLTRLAIPKVALYSAVKLAIEQLGRALSRELAPRGIRVNTLAPGLTLTDRTAATASGDGTGTEPGSTPFARPGDPQEIADAVLFLASSDGRWVNTQSLYVNGGSIYAQ
ncbi:MULTISPECIES: SDR family oxidoreductase [unclassified Sphingomonas]|nr:MULTISPECIES: SDR family oxidoreductase [unclassified Sphingomonas]